MDSVAYLLDEEVEGDTKRVENSPWWRISHALGFITGGTTFIAGTWYLYLPSTEETSFLSSLLYIIGSVGFLYVDVLEFFTFTEDFFLRCNIAISAAGSFFYVIGSCGFLPQFPSLPSNFSTPLVGDWGFILGSILIGCSQVWKLVRIGWDKAGGYSPLHNFSSKEVGTSTGVEGGACVGAWCFFVGTVLYLLYPVTLLQVVLWTWMVGSIFFTLGGFFLAYRHFVMGV